MDFPIESKLKRVAKTLVRFLNISSESKLIVLTVLQQLSLNYPEIVKEHYRSITIIQIEKLYCKIKKLEILANLIDEHNFSTILEELLYHTKSNQQQLVAVAVQLLGKTTLKYPQFIKKTIRALVEILRNGTVDSKNHVVQSFCSLMTDYIDDITDVRYKGNLIKMLRKQVHQIPTVSLEILRKLTIKFTSYHENVKYEIILLAYEINSLQATPIYSYLLQLGQFDQSLLLRDLVRSISKLEYETTDSKFARLASSISSDRIMPQQQYRIGSLSHLVGFAVKGYKQVVNYCQDDTTELRKEQEEVVAKKPVPQVVQPKQQQPPAPEQQQAPQAPQKKKKEIEDDVKKHFQNLDQVLNDFFVDE